MRHLLLRAIAPAAAVCLAVCPALAQYQSGGSGMSGTFGGQSLRSSGRSSQSGGSSFGVTRGSSSGGMGSSAGITRGSSGGGQSQSGGQQGDFVGADSRDLQNLFSQMSSSAGQTGRGTRNYGSRNTQGYGSRSSSSQSRRSGQGGQGADSSTTFRTLLRVGFDYPKPTASQLATTLRAQLARSTTIRWMTPLDVSVVDGTAILRGTVATDHEKALAERMTRLESGIRAVENQLAVSPAASDASSDSSLREETPAHSGSSPAGAPPKPTR